MNKIKNLIKGKAKIFFILLLLIIIVVFFALISKNDSQINEVGEYDNLELVNDFQPALSDEDLNSALLDAQPYFIEDLEMEIEIPDVLREAVVVVPGASPVTRDGLVLTEDGELAQNNIEPMSPGAPRQTEPISEEDLSTGSIRLSVSIAAGWTPNEFVVKAGMPVTLAISSIDESTYLFKFVDDSLSAVAIGVSPGETRAITFNAPDSPGEYQFISDIPGHVNRGLTGMMIVQ